ncbi:MAG TPA: DNA primase small subunit PriS [Candidatus Bathyarchaeia archaeon]|nr:DNA primase small subunit PriS [Candidatus Bathyarchaeia archaeon]
MPNSFENREFAALLFKEKMMVRHKSFKGPYALKKFLCELIPSDVYYSSAYYENPASSDMGEKTWLGADLVFDIDADHIPTPCGKIHDRWACGNCGFSGMGVTPDICPSCGGRKIDVKTWICEECLQTTKRETLKLMKFLTDDFGFSAAEIKIFFSGHRGYHVHLESKTVRSLDALARKEIVDYVAGIGLNESLFGVKEIGKAISGPNLKDVGWSGRIAEGVYEVLANYSLMELEDLGLKKRAVEAVDNNKDTIIKNRGARSLWNNAKGIGTESWKRIARRGIELQSAKIDTVVTTDIHRLIRLNGTLHGKTGLKKTEVSSARLEDFDPLRKAVAFEKGTTEVFVHQSPEFRIGDTVYGALTEQKVELPVAAALFLLCKGAAEVAM